jgi:hypothetical protein
VRSWQGERRAGADPRAPAARPPRSTPAEAAARVPRAGAAADVMYIEEIVVDGFKSYAQRTVVPSFDPFFNAITGLNGSGKSNILDSICFVLGITNLSQARSDVAGAWGF